MNIDFKSEVKIEFLQAKINGGTEKTGVVSTEVPIMYVPQGSGECIVVNEYVTATIVKQDGTIFAPVAYHCDKRDVKIVEGKFNGANEPFGEAFAYLSAVIEEYNLYHGTKLFGTPLEFKFFENSTLAPQASWSPNHRNVQVVTGNATTGLYALTAKTILAHELAHAISRIRQTRPTSDDTVIDEAFADIFAIFFANYSNVKSGGAIDWAIGRGYSRTADAIRYVDHPRKDGSTEAIREITSRMNQYQRGGFIRKLFFNFYTGLRASGKSSLSSLELSYGLFYKACIERWFSGMTYDDFAHSLIKVYFEYYSSLYGEGVLKKAMQDVGIVPIVKYRLYNKGGYIARLKVTYLDGRGLPHTVFSSQVPVGQATEVAIPIEGSPHALIYPQIDYFGFKSFKMLSPGAFDNNCVVTWGTIFSPQASIGGFACDF